MGNRDTRKPTSASRRRKVLAVFAVALMTFVCVATITDYSTSSDGDNATVINETIHIDYKKGWRLTNDPHIPNLTIQDNCLVMDGVNVSMVHRDLMRAMSINQSENTLKIIVRGNNTISHVSTIQSYMSCALYCRAPLEIVGEGTGATLTLNTCDLANFTYGMLIERTTVISNVKIICNTGASLEKSCGIHADGDLTIDGSEIEITTKESKDTRGIDAQSVTLNLKNYSVINATAGNATLNSVGMIASEIKGNFDFITATGGNVTGTGGYSAGVELTDNEATITGVIINATGGISTSKSYGILFSEGYNDGAISNSVVRCIGNDSAVTSYESGEPTACNRSLFDDVSIVKGSTSAAGTYYDTITSGTIGLQYKNVKVDYICAVTYISEGSTGAVPTQDPILTGDSFTVAEPTGMSREGYTFGGWYDGTRTYFAGETYTTYNKDVRLTAIWNKLDDDMNVTTDKYGRAEVILPAESSVETVKVSNGKISVFFGEESTDMIKGNAIYVTIVAAAGKETYDVVVKLNDENFDGKMTVSLPYKLGKGNPVVYWKEGITETEMPSTANAKFGTVSFETEHNSTYLVKYKQTPSNDYTIAIILAGIIVATIVSAAFYFRKN